MPTPTPSRWPRPDVRPVGVAGIVAGAVLLVGACGGDEPLVTFRQDVPDDVEAEAIDAVAAFNGTFSARRGCVDGVEVVLVDHVEGGDARYVGDAATIEIAIPTSPRRFRESLLHELAHHVEHRCAEFDRLAEQILSLTGGETWSGQARWEDRPAEHWAEAVVEVSLGERVRFGRSMPLDPAVVEAVRAWAAGD